MLDRLFNSAQIPLLEQNVRFAQARERVLADDIVNLDTPNYTPKDLSLEGFHKLLSERAEGGTPSGGGDGLDDALKAEPADDNILFHDRNNRSVEQLMADNANNALMHNMMIELMRKQFAQIQEALKERVT